jgi:hypothetical protein
MGGMSVLRWREWWASGFMLKGDWSYVYASNKCIYIRSPRLFIANQRVYSWIESET